MIAWTTPTINVHVPLSLSGATAVVTVRQSTPHGSVTVSDESPDVSVEDDESVVTATFTQEQTGQLQEGPAKLQCNWKLGDGTRGAITPVMMYVHENLVEEVM